MQFVPLHLVIDTTEQYWKQFLFISQTLYKVVTLLRMKRKF